MKKINLYYIMVLMLALTPLMSGCVSASNNEVKESTGTTRGTQEKSKEDEEHSEEEQENLKKEETKEDQNAYSEKMSDSEIRQILQKDFNNHIKTNNWDEAAWIITDSAELYELKPDRLHAPAVEEFRISFAQLREHYPGTYRYYLKFYDESDKEKFINTDENVEIKCLCINENTGKTFIAYTGGDIYAFSDLEPVAYGLESPMPESYLVLWAAWKKGYIENMDDYATEWTMREYYPEWKGAINADPDIDYYGGESFESVIPIIKISTSEQVAVLNCDIKHYKVSNYYTGQLIYQDPLTKYLTKDLTKENAPEEAFDILQKLGILDEKINYLLEVEGEEEISTPLSSEMIEGYQIAVRSQGDEAAPVIARYLISKDAVRLAEYDIVTDSYTLIYGTRMP